MHARGRLWRSVLPLPAREPLLDLLEQPAVAIWIAEGRIGEVGPTLRVRTGSEPGLVTVEQLAHLDAATNEVLTRRVDIGDDQLNAEPSRAWQW